jgi:uncharacterized protein (DUF1330 family)
MNAYVVFTRERTTDEAELKIYAEKAGAAREGHAMTPLVHYGRIDMLEGAPVEGCVILSFPTMAEAHGWYDSPAYQDALQHRLKGSDYRVFIVEGLNASAG